MRQVCVGMKKTTIVLSIVCLVIMGILINRNISVRTENENLNHEKVKIKKEIDRLQLQDTTGSALANDKFLNGMFTYSDAQEQYHTVGELTTDKGLMEAFPSRSSDFKGTGDLTSSLLSLDFYNKVASENITSFMNVVQVKTEYKDVSSKVNMLVKTTLKREDERWLVDGVEFVSTY